MTDDWQPTCPICDAQDWPAHWMYGDDDAYAIRCHSCGWTISLHVLKEQRPPRKDWFTEGVEIFAESLANFHRRVAREALEGST